ncbi:MAG: SEL1-like repeat protein [Caulobacterales bacterium]|nr:SEL1-like repeat protein [Caulobacterales bacterium]
MSGAAPWSVKGIEPRTREVAKDLARRSGMTLGEWLSEMIAENGADDFGDERRRQPRRYDDAYSMRGEDATAALRSIEALSSRLEGSERRSLIAIDGVDRAVAGLVRRMEEAEVQASSRDRRLEEMSESMRESRARVRQFEDETGPRYTEAFGKIEGAIGKLAGQFYESEARGRDASQALRDRVERIERDGTSDRAVEGVVNRISQRLEEAQSRTTNSLAKLEQSFADLDRRLARAETGQAGIGQAAGLEKLAEGLTRKVEESRTEMLRRLDLAASDGRMDKVERALAELGAHLQESERRQAKALEAMGREVVRIASNFDGRLKDAERTHQEGLVATQEKALKAVETMGQELSKSLGSDVTRVAEAIEHRLRRADDQHAMGLEKLGGEISRISERLAERISQSERRAAQGVDELTDRLNKASEKMEGRYERASGELAERMRQSEERTVRLLAEARESIDKQLAKRSSEAALGWESEAFPAAEIDGGWPTEPGAATAQDPLDDFGPVDDGFAAPAPAMVARTPETQAISPADSFVGLEPEHPAMDPFAASQTPFAGPAASPFSDPFGPATEFMADRPDQAERPLSTREAIEAARAATRRGETGEDVADERRSFGFRLGGGKSRLQKRVEKQGRREGSTLGKALAATTTAAVVVGFGVAGVLGYQRLVQQGSAIPGIPVPVGQDLAAAATSPTELAIAPPSDQAQAEAQALFDQAMPLIDAGDAEGVRMMSRAANLGFPSAQMMMARLYETGEAGVAVDLTESRRWAERAANGGDVNAMHFLAMYLYQGTGGPADQAQAMQWFEEAAGRGYVDSQYNLARLYERGIEGMAPDLTRAYQWYIVAGRSGDAGAEEAAARLRSQVPASQRLIAERAANSFQAEAAQG